MYVDYLLLIDTCTKFIRMFIDELGSRFSLKNPQQLSLFLGIDVQTTSAGLFLSQHHYVRKILVAARMDGSKPISTPFATITVLSKNDTTTLEVDVTDYRKIGALQYLAWTARHLFFCEQVVIIHAKSN